MPIAKRSTLPATAPHKPRNSPQPPGPSLQSLVVKHDKLSSDLSWDGKHTEAMHHAKLAHQYRERIANGELYEPDF